VGGLLLAGGRMQAQSPAHAPMATHS